MKNELLDTAIQAARKGAEILELNFEKFSVKDATEKGTHDFVTEVDKMSERAIIDYIMEIYPDHAVLAEESGYNKSESKTRWIIDPLDGTTNFIHKYPIFAVSVAAEVDGKIAAGVVIDVTRKEEFTAARGEGAFLNGEKIEVSPIDKLDKALVLTGFPFKAYNHMEDFITVFRELLPATSGIRRAGSAAIDLAHIASGRAEGFWEFGLSAWDIAAGALIIEEAGGIITDVENGDGYLESGNVLCGNPRIHESLHKMIMKNFEKGHFVNE